MWVGQSVDIAVARNATTPLGFQMWDAVENVPLDITGYTFSCSIYNFDGLTKITDHGVDVVSYTEGQYNITFDGRLYNLEGDQELVKASYQILADDGNEPVEAQRGIIFLFPGGVQ